jgi:hypothetical protein
MNLDNFNYFPLILLDIDRSPGRGGGGGGGGQKKKKKKKKY